MSISLLLLIASFSHAHVDQKVRVKVMTSTFPIIIEGKSITINSRSLGDVVKISIPQTEKVEINHVQIAERSIWVTKKGSEVFRTSENFLEINSLDGQVTIGAVPIPTPLLLSNPVKRKTVDVIVALNVEDYLHNVLNSEMPTSWPLEALKSQAIASRTYTLYQMNARRQQPYQLESTVLDQVYSLKFHSKKTKAVDQAIKETREKVLTVDGKMIKAYYHSDCGGQTEEPRQIWGSHKDKHHMGSVVDDHGATSPYSHWNFEISLKDLGNKLALLDTNFQTPKQAEVLSYTPSQRVALLAFNDGHEHVTVSGNELRRLIGYDKLRSTLFDIEQKDGYLKFSGKGFGHGSGLCQWGSRYLANKGKRAGEILSHYYPYAQVTAVNAADL